MKNQDSNHQQKEKEKRLQIFKYHTTDAAFTLEIKQWSNVALRPNLQDNWFMKFSKSKQSSPSLSSLFHRIIIENPFQYKPLITAMDIININQAL